MKNPNLRLVDQMRVQQVIMDYIPEKWMSLGFIIRTSKYEVKTIYQKTIGNDKSY